MTAGELLHESLPIAGLDSRGRPVAQQCTHMLRSGDYPGDGLRRGHVFGMVRFYGLNHECAIVAMLGTRGIFYAYFKDSAPDLLDTWISSHTNRPRLAEVVEPCEAMQDHPEDGPCCPYERIAPANRPTTRDCVGWTVRHS